MTEIQGDDVVRDAIHKLKDVIKEASGGSSSKGGFFLPYMSLRFSTRLLCDCVTLAQYCLFAHESVMSYPSESVCVYAI